MSPHCQDERRALENLSPEALQTFQFERLCALWQRIIPANAFYQNKFAAHPSPPRTLEQLRALPFTRKHELISGRDDDLAANHTFPLEHYVRFHRTSGTHGRPLVVLDTADDWRHWIESWQYVLDAAELTSADRVLMAFSFGPFIGFWSAFDAVAARGALAIPTGGMNSWTRLELLRSTRATAVFCTPSYALHLADVAAEHRFDLLSLGVRRIVVAGEPGGSIPATRARIERLWGARVIDHAGATEVGPWGYQAFVRGEPAGLHVNESQFLPEFLALDHDGPAQEGELSELVLTTLGRVGCPVFRYRTGDLVRPVRRHDAAGNFVLLDGGVLGRIDDMIVVRGVNIFPSSIEAIVRRFPEIDEYRLIARKQGAMDALTLELELPRPTDAERLANELQLQLGLKVEVHAVPPGSLPRWEAKARRFVDQRAAAPER